MGLSNLRLFATSWGASALACTLAVAPSSRLYADDVPQKDLSPPAAAAPETPSAASTISDPLAAQVQQAIEVTSRRFLETEVHTPWQIVHGLLAYRRDYQIKQNGVKVNALNWSVAWDPSYKNQPLSLKRCRTEPTRIRTTMSPMPFRDIRTSSWRI